MSSIFVCNWAGKVVPEFIAFTTLKTSKGCVNRLFVCSNLTISYLQPAGQIGIIAGKPHFFIPFSQKRKTETAEQS